MAIGPQLAATLKRYGLDSLSEWASEAIIQGKSEAQIMLEIYDQPAFKAEYPAIAQREALGLPPISVEQYLQYRQTVNALSSMWDLNLTKQDIDSYIVNDLSPVEVESRINIAAAAVYEDAPETRAELERLYGISQGQLIKFWMDPKKEMGTLQNQYRTGQIAGASIRTGFGQITQVQAARLQQAGVTEDQAMQGFGQLANSKELFASQGAGEEEITQDEQISILAGDATALAKVETRASRRKKEFEGRGGFAAGQEGFATGTAK